MLRHGGSWIPGSMLLRRSEAGWLLFVVAVEAIGYIGRMISKALRIVLADHARLPWRFFGRLTAVQAGL